MNRRWKSHQLSRAIEKIGHHFTSETINNLRIRGGDFLLQSKVSTFKEMIFRHVKAFAFKVDEIGCVHPKMVTPMVIFTIPHIPRNFKPIAVPRARLPQLLELSKDKVKMKILETSNATYSNRCFTVPKRDVRHIPEDRLNMISAGRLDDESYTSSIQNGVMKFCKGNLIVAKA